MTSGRRGALASVVLAVVALALGVLPGARAEPDRLQWSIPSRDEAVQAVFGGVAVLANEQSARLVSLADGRVVGTLRATWRDWFTVAGDRLLVIGNGYVTLYDRSARPVWPAPVRADRGVAAFAGVTAVERRGEVTAIADDGTVRWTRAVDPYRQGDRFPIVPRLPADNIYLSAGPPILPGLAPLPVAGGWEFADATGRAVAVAAGTYAGMVGDTPVTSTLVGDRCEMWLGGARRELDCTFGKPWAMGGQLYVERGTGTVVPADGPAGGPVAATPGEPGVRVAGDGVLAVYAAGRVTVSDPRTGEVTGWVGARATDSVWPAAPGQALVATGDDVVLVGAGPTGP